MRAASATAQARAWTGAVPGCAVVMPDQASSTATAAVAEAGTATPVKTPPKRRAR
ncbi:hypothetical protein [Streptomyces aureus]|uniref:hypothetical protein n=1 Tax=Streptomyces aureus TaxID=193461 RepID=UPI0033FDE4C1